jgi:redox-sensitive bicupin YhaK (pirin superfamily)
MFVTHPTQRTHFKGFQLWVNLPARLKMSEPSYDMIWSRDMPTARLPLGGTARVISGQVGDVQSRIIKSIPLTILHLTLPPGERFATAVPRTHSALAYVFAGAVDIGPGGAAKRVERLSWGLLAADGDGVEMHSVGSEPADVLFLAGQPLKVCVLVCRGVVMQVLMWNRSRLRSGGRL